MDEKQTNNNIQKEKLTKQQERWAIFGALKAALAVALIFGGVYFLFILFCDNVWFK